MGFKFTSKQVINKCKNLRRQYTSAKDENNKSGNPPTDWVFFPEMDEIFGDRPVSKPKEIRDTMDEMTFIDLMDDANSVNTDTTVGSEASAADFEDVEENDSLLDLLQDDQNKQQLDVATEEFLEGTAGASGGNKKRKMPDTTEGKRQSQTVLKSRKKAKTEEMVAGFSNSLMKKNLERSITPTSCNYNRTYEDRKRKEEAEEKRRDEERAHERQMQMLSMFDQMFAGRQQPAQPLHPAPPAEAGHSGFSQQQSHPARLGYSGR